MLSRWWKRRRRTIYVFNNSTTNRMLSVSVWEREHYYLCFMLFVIYIILECGVFNTPCIQLVSFFYFLIKNYNQIQWEHWEHIHTTMCGELFFLWCKCKLLMQMHKHTYINIASIWILFFLLCLWYEQILRLLFSFFSLFPSELNPIEGNVA